MRDRQEIIEEMAAVRDDLVHNVEGLRQAVAEKVDVRAHAQRLLERVSEVIRTRSWPAIGVALLMGMWMGRGDRGQLTCR